MRSTPIPLSRASSFNIYWAVLEGPKAGDYSQGFEVLDSYLQKLGSLKIPRRLMVVIDDRAFSNYDATRMDAIKIDSARVSCSRPPTTDGYVTGEGSGGSGAGRANLGEAHYGPADRS